jgi:hypothetical protein
MRSEQRRGSSSCQGARRAGAGAVRQQCQQQRYACPKGCLTSAAAACRRGAVLQQRHPRRACRADADGAPPPAHALPCLLCQSTEPNDTPIDRERTLSPVMRS